MCACLVIRSPTELIAVALILAQLYPSLTTFTVVPFFHRAVPQSLTIDAQLENTIDAQLENTISWRCEVSSKICCTLLADCEFESV
mmetsp:Transcript_5925/g.10701  ORF Transcript_5925/g.10701 Transcript_5925/m.10701 type:complete len:86 (-) Transcript_5925:51-308(-)